MRSAVYAAAAATLTLGLSALATPASAAIALESDASCDIYDLSEGCRFSFQGNEHSDIAGIFAAYNAAIDPDLDTPDYLGKVDGVDNDGDDLPDGYVADFTYDFGNIVVSNDGETWTFTNLPFGVSFFTVKAGGSELLLFGLDPEQTGFAANNVSITVGNKGNLAAISHVSFYGGDGGGGGNAVPEPGTWALMILGFGGAGAMLRRRKTVVA